VTGRRWLIPALLALAVLALGQPACGGDDDNGEDAEQATVTETTEAVETQATETQPTVTPPTGGGSAEAAALVDRAGNEQEFCNQYNAAISGGATDQQAFKAFESGYGQQAGPTAPDAREVFDEYVSRC
jgi:hypothetical protein